MMGSDTNREESIQLIVNRLHSQDANDRVKAAAELGEVGTTEEAPALLEAAYEDEASTVRQMAIQAYAEILQNESLNEILKAARDHYDEYVRLYAITVLGRLDTSLVADTLPEFLKEEDNRLVAATLRSMIHAETKSNAGDVFELLKTAEEDLVVRNCIEALALWKDPIAKEYVKSTYFDKREQYSVEIQTISAFYLAVLGDKGAFQFLKTKTIDNYIRLIIDDKRFGGRKGLLDAVDYLR